MKKEKPLTINRLTIYSLLGKPFRTGSLITVVFVLTISLFSGSIISACLQNGLNSLKDRLGADLAIIPKGYESQYEGIILSGEPVRFYLDQSIVLKVAEIEGVTQVTAQFYLSTLTAECCSVPIQIIGIDPDTDFVTKPWISRVYIDELGDGQMIAGFNVWPDIDRKLTFFNIEFPVVAKLEKTSINMDNSVYINLRTVRKLAHIAKEIGVTTNVDNQNVDIDNAVSSVLVKTDKGYDVDRIATKINRLIDGVSIVKSKKVFSGISGRLSIIQSYINLFSVMFWVLAAIIQTVLFSVIINSRKKEFSVLRIFGATRKKLTLMVFVESIYLGILGGILGILVIIIIFFPLSTYIGNQIVLPFLMPSIERIIMYFIIAFMLSSVTGPISTIYAAFRINKADAYAALREGE